ncbi:MAG TPA: glutamine synthetase family protein [Candidatus Saccharimonadales bacterium]|nr:glutamine synthetase family protein [Candidatus Saccharimonadales bacterium]
MQPQPDLKKFLELTYDELEEKNKKTRLISDPVQAEKENTTALEKEKGIKAVTVCFCNIEGRLHMLDYDKEFLLRSLDNLTFDGSSIRGFSELHESDLRLNIDWTSLTYLPSDVFGPGKVAVFANIADKDGKPYNSDFRGRLQDYAGKVKKSKGIEGFMAPEIEGFVLKGLDAEQHYNRHKGFELMTTGGYYNTLPLDKLRSFIDTVADVLRAMGFNNEKDHPEVAPSQFESNFSYTDVVRACDQILLYKLVCRQVAHSLGMTATFLPKPVQGLNGNGMHTNFSLAKNGKNIFYDKAGRDNLSKYGWEVISKVLNRASEISLILNSSVNAYRRLDPNYEAPNQIKASAQDRGSMVRVPLGNERSARIEIRSVSPDANPYLLMYTIMNIAIDDKVPARTNRRERLKFLPGNVNDAIRQFRASSYTTALFGKSTKDKYLEYKVASAHRNPKELGDIIKESEILYHHEVTNQHLWSIF